MNKEVIALMQEAMDRGCAVALATLTESGTGAPGVPGSMLALTADGKQAGTVGGGAAEAEILRSCRAALEGDGGPILPFDYDLEGGGELGMVCGGRMKGYINVIRPGGRLIIFGGGHVGQKIYQAGLVAGFSVTLVEDREEYAPLFPQAEVIITADFGEAARALLVDASCYAVIVTRGHTQDYAVLSTLAGRETAYLGMIGSRKKVAALLEQLRREGAGEEAIRRIYSPVGLDIDDGTPGEIAIGIMAEILAVKNSRPLRHSRERRDFV